VIKIEGEKISKCKDFKIEMHGVWNEQQGQLAPSVSYKKYLSNVPGMQDIKEIQKAAILGTVHVLWKVLM
jgi:hypothetical protein